MQRRIGYFVVSVGFLTSCGARSALQEDGAAAGGVTAIGGQAGFVPSNGGAGEGGLGGSGGEPIGGGGGSVEPGCPVVNLSYCQAAEPCYDGPPETEGQGVCAAGARECNSYETARSGCAGQVLPRPDNCLAPTAWSCDGGPHPCLALLEWREVVGSVVKLFALDDDSYIAADYGGIYRVDGGVEVWSTTPSDAPTSNYAEMGMAVDKVGNVFLAGEANDGSGLASQVTKIAASGAVLWSRRIEAPPGQEASLYAIAAAPDGGAWIAGQGATTIDDKVLKDGLSYVAKLDASGKAQWLENLSAPADGFTYTMAAGLQGSVLMGGILFGDPCAGGNAGITSFDADGRRNWSWSTRSYPAGPNLSSGGTDSNLTQLAVAVDGSIYATGRMGLYSTGTAIDFGDGDLKDGGTFLVKLSPSGEHLWSRAFAESNQSFNSGGFLSVSAAGNVVWANAVVNGRVMLRTFSPTGTLLWERRLEVDPPGSGVLPKAMLVFPDGRMMLSGVLNGEADFGLGPLPNSSFLSIWGP